MKNLEIFDKDGTALHVADIVYSFIKDSAEKANKDIEDVYVGVAIGIGHGKTPIWIETVESVDNGYDATDLHSFGDAVKVKSIN